MKTPLLFILTVFLALPSLAQEESKSSDDSFQTTRVGFGEMSGFNMGPGFINPRTRTEGSAYYFDNWDTEALIYLKEQGRYKVEKVNINLLDHKVEALYDENNVVTLETENLLQVRINNKVFRPLTLDKKLKLLELVFNKKVSVYKYSSVSFTKSDPNPMINRKTNKYFRNEKYYLYEGGQLTRIKLTTKSFAKRFASGDLSETSIIDYIKTNNLSLKKESDLLQVLNFVNK